MQVSASRLLGNGWLQARFMHDAANCVSYAVNCHIEHIACLLSFDMSERGLAFEINGLGLFCWFVTRQAWRLLIRKRDRTQWANGT